MFAKSYRPVTPEFASETRNVRCVLIVDVGGLGDLVHALPAMQAIRQSYPDARVDALVKAPFAPLLKLTPWIDRVWPYAGRSKSLRLHDLRMARLLHAEGYEVSIDLMGSNRSCLLARLTGARWRLGRRPREENRYAWRWLNTHVMEQPYLAEPRYKQKWKCVAQAGLITREPDFRIDDPSAELHALGIAPAPGEGGYIHFSPYTTNARRELPPEQVAALLARMRGEFPEMKLVLSCAADHREKSALESLLATLPFAPWKTFAGTLDAAQLFAVVKRAALHLSGDTGTMHLAWLASTPSVSWFVAGASNAEWLPVGPRHEWVFAPEKPLDTLRGIDTEAVIAAARRAMAAGSKSVPG